MYKRTISYEDFDGNKRTEDAYFNFTKTELTKLNLTHPGGLHAYAERIVSEQNGDELCKLFDDIILKAYGKKSDDGRSFMKSEAISNEFASTLAYDQLFTELATDAKKFAEFFNAIIPSDSKLSNDQINSAIEKANAQVG